MVVSSLGFLIASHKSWTEYTCPKSLTGTNRICFKKSLCIYSNDTEDGGLTIENLTGNTPFPPVTRNRKSRPTHTQTHTSFTRACLRKSAEAGSRHSDALLPPGGAGGAGYVCTAVQSYLTL